MGLDWVRRDGAGAVVAVSVVAVVVLPGVAASAVLAAVMSRKLV